MPLLVGLPHQRTSRLRNDGEPCKAVKDITTGQPTSTLKENQMYDWDGPFDDTLGLPLQLRNRVSNPGTPTVRASPRAPGYGGGAGGATVNIGSGPGWEVL